jgi:hypothetical protein
MPRAFQFLVDFGQGGAASELLFLHFHETEATKEI